MKSNADKAEKVAGNIAQALMQGGDKVKESIASALSQGVKIPNINASSTAADVMGVAASGAGDLAFSESSLKTASSILDINAKKDAGILNQDGSVSATGREALAIKPGEDANAMKGKVNIGKNTQEILDNARSKIYNAEKKLGKSDDEANAIADEAVKPFLDKDGHALKGQDFWNKQAELKSGVFSGSNSMLLGGGKMFSGALGPDGSVTGKISSGVAFSKDDSVKQNDSTVKTTGSGTKDESGYQISPTGLLQKALTKIGIPEGGADVAAEMVKDGGIILAADQILTKGAGRKAATETLTNAYHRVKKHEMGIDTKGNKVWSSNDKWKALEKEGLAEKTENGWKTALSKDELKEHFNQKSGLDLKNATTANTTNSATGVKNSANTGADISDSLNKDNSIVSKSTENFKAAQEKYNNAVANTEAIKNTRPQDLAKQEMVGLIDNKLSDPSLPKESRANLTKLRANVTGGGKVNPEDFYNAGVSQTELDEHGIHAVEKEYKDKKTGEKVKSKFFNMKSAGETIKAHKEQEATIEQYDAQNNLEKSVFEYMLLLDL